MPEIGRSFDTLNKKIKQLTTEIRTSKAEVRDLDKSLKLNPNDVDKIRQKYAALSDTLSLAAEKVTLLKNKQSTLTDEFKNGNISQSEYEKELVKVQKALNKAEGEVNDLTSSLSKQNAEIRNAKFNNIIDGLTKTENIATKTSKAALGVVAALGAIFTSAISHGSELDDLAKKYDTTAEELQIQQHVYERLTGSADGYTASLAKIGSMQSSISAGRGARYLEYLNRLGISQSELSNKSNAEVYDLIYERLRLVTDGTERATIAQGLLGDEGLNLANMAGVAADEIEKLKQEMIDTGIVTNEQAAAAGEAGDMIDDLKYDYQAASAELLASALPALETLFGLLKDSVVPILNTMASGLSAIGPTGQKVLLLLLAVIVVLPKIIALVKTGITLFNLLKAATLAQAGATATLNAVSTPWLGIIMAISLALIGLIALISMFTGNAKSATDISNDLLSTMDETQSKLNEMGYDLDYSTEQTYNSNSRRELDINVNVEAKGDGTEIDDSNAQRIGGYIYDQMSIDLINQLLGLSVR